MRKVIYWELCKIFNFEYTTKWYTRNSESVPENETQAILWDFEIYTDHLISIRRPDFELISGFYRSSGPLNENKRKINKYLNHGQITKKLWNMRLTVILIVGGALETVPKGLERELEQLEIAGNNELHCWDRLEYSAESWKPEKIYGHSDSSESPIANDDGKISQETKIPIVIGALGTVSKRLVQRLEDLEIRGRVETIQTSVFLKTVRIWRRVLENWGDSSGKPSANADDHTNKWELKKLWNMKLTIIPIVIGALGTVTKGLVKGLEDMEIMGRVETIQNKALLRSARILRIVLEICGDLLSLKFQWKPSAKANVKNFQGEN